MKNLTIGYTLIAVLLCIAGLFLEDEKSDKFFQASIIFAILAVAYAIRSLDTSEK